MEDNKYSTRYGGSGNRFKRGKQREEEKLNIENTRQKDSTWKIDKKLASHGNTHDKQSRNITFRNISTQ